LLDDWENIVRKRCFARKQENLLNKIPFERKITRFLLANRKISAIFNTIHFTITKTGEK
jgi:hypothetical protein